LLFVRYVPYCRSGAREIFLIGDPFSDALTQLPQVRPRYDATHSLKYCGDPGNNHQPDAGEL
jgi:hypothetical protein